MHITLYTINIYVYLYIHTFFATRRRAPTSLKKNPMFIWRNSYFESDTFFDYFDHGYTWKIPVF